jgi:KUP system potassium uptake protein
MPQVLEEIASGRVVRVPGSAVFLTISDLDVPPLLAWYVLKNRALHQTVFVLNVVNELVPYVSAEGRAAVQEIAPRVWRARARYGFMERPDVPYLVHRAKEHGFPLDASDVVYYIGHETIVAREDRKGLPHIVEAIFAFLHRNAAPMADYFHMPRNQVVEIGAEFSL